MSFQFVILSCAAALAAVSAISEDAAVAAERRRHWAEVLERQEKIFYETGLAQLSPIQARYAQFFIRRAVSIITVRSLSSYLSSEHLLGKA